MNRRSHAFALTVALFALAAPGTLTAQQLQTAPAAAPTQIAPATQRAATQASPAARAPHSDALHFQPSAVRAPATTPALPAAAPVPPTKDQSRVMMVVGGAAFVVGAIVGNDAGTVIMVGGLVVGLFGLYNYLQ